MSARKPALNGSRLSQHTKPRSPKKPLDRDRMLAQVYRAYQHHDDPTVNALMKQDFVFHMTDWTEDLDKLYQLYQDPSQFSRQEANDIVAGFVIHASSHINAAASLLLDFKPLVFDDPRDAVVPGD